MPNKPNCINQGSGDGRRAGDYPCGGEKRRRPSSDWMRSREPRRAQIMPAGSQEGRPFDLLSIHASTICSGAAEASVCSRSPPKFLSEMGDLWANNVGQHLVGTHNGKVRENPPAEFIKIDRIEVGYKLNTKVVEESKGAGRGGRRSAGPCTPAGQRALRAHACATEHPRMRTRVSVDAAGVRRTCRALYLCRYDRLRETGSSIASAWAPDASGFVLS
uniref:Uncharacterized protein n=1 Tax=Oryza sativa subsp. japonica TaxID=39947 RepID=Q6Z400_ORYSJ|nr:hypothetical protein [Oryza sativa Japonica Group]